ncbi:MAG: ornithine cyclodeaminase family protein [Oscillochloridaceae bacterium umkhey_bin13]
MRVLSADDVRQAVPMLAAIDAVEAAFISLSAGQAEAPLRAHISTPDYAAISFFMPARLGGTQPALGLKVVSVFPDNPARGEPSIYALVTVLDPSSGRPVAVLDGTYLTALRTGAASGVATRHMARPDARCLVVLGAGAQAFHQAMAVCAVRSIEQIWLVNRTPARAEQLAERLRTAGVIASISVITDPALALAQADVVCAATSASSPVFADHDLQPGTHLNGVGSYKPSMAEIPAATVARARLVVDQRQAAWAEAGDLVLAREAGLITERHVVAELGEVATGQIAGRTSPDQITFFKSVGNAVQDVAVAAVALARAETLGLGVEVAM